MVDEAAGSEHVPVLVTGGTGMLGRRVVAELRRRGYAVRVLSRHPATDDAPGVERVVGDLTTGAGLTAAVDGVRTVVHCASEPNRPAQDVEAAGRLLAAARGAGTAHLIDISIVGVDAVPYGYYRAKREVEDLVETGGVPWTILRTTQFHQFVAQLLDRLGAGPVALVPRGLRVQPIDVGEVATRLVDLVEAGPSGRVEDMGGPQVLAVGEAMRIVAAARGRRSLTLAVPIPGRTMRAFRAGRHLTPDRAVGRRTFAEAVADAP